MIWFCTQVIKLLSRLLSVLPRSLQLVLGSILGLTWFYLVRIRRSIVLENIQKAFPNKTSAEVNQIAKKNYINYGQSFIELLLLPSLDQSLFASMTEIIGFENYKKAFDQGQGVFLLTLHMGSWEYMSATCEFLKIPLHVITKKFKASGLNQIWVNLRMLRGIKLIKEEKSTFEILRAIRSGEVVGFILDQFMGPPAGVRTTFFGYETGTASSLALFADRTNAPVVPVYNVRTKEGKLRIIFEEPVIFMEQGGRDENISFMTQAYTSRIEEIIKKYPEQWMWLHRRWKPFRE